MRLFHYQARPDEDDSEVEVFADICTLTPFKAERLTVSICTRLCQNQIEQTVIDLTLLAGKNYMFQLLGPKYAIFDLLWQNLHSLS